LTLPSPPAAGGEGRVRGRARNDKPPPGGLRRPARPPGGTPMWTRREVLIRGAGTVATLAGGGGALRALCGDAPRAGALAQGMITPAAQQAIDQGPAYLEGAQHQDGSFGTNQHRGNVAITSLAGLAFMAGGNQPGRGRYGRAVTRTLEFVLSQEQQ